MTGAEARSPNAGACVGVLLAAGRSRRMGVPKLALPWPPPDDGAEPRPAPDPPPIDPPTAATTTIIGHVYDAMAPWCDAMVVVLGGDAEAVARVLGGRPFIEVQGDPDAPMFDSVRRGVKAAVEGRVRPDVLLLAPGDHVGVAAADIGVLLRAASIEPACVHIPQSSAGGGHPVAIPAGLVPEILAWRGEGGLAGLWRSAPALVRRHAAGPADVRIDIDSPQDYRRSPRQPPGTGV